MFTFEHPAICHGPPEQDISRPLDCIYQTAFLIGGRRFKGLAAFDIEGSLPSLISSSFLQKSGVELEETGLVKLPIEIPDSIGGSTLNASFQVVEHITVLFDNQPVDVSAILTGSIYRSLQKAWESQRAFSNLSPRQIEITEAESYKIVLEGSIGEDPNEQTSNKPVEETLARKADMEDWVIVQVLKP